MESIGITNVYLNNIYLVFLNMMSSGTAFYLADKLGRRWFMAGGALIEAVSMYIVAGLAGVSGTQTESQQKGALAALFIWQAFQACSWASW